MIRFALAWELCVWDHQRAVVEAFKFLRNKHDARAASFPLLGLLQSIAVLPYPGGNGPERPVAYPILPPERLDAAFTPIIDPLWRPWDDCALRVVADKPARELYAAWRNSRGRLIAWLQRDYLHTELAKLGPDVGHEDDWPLDLDHLQPSSSFDFDWRDRKRLDVDSNEKSREARFTIGNAVGNFAWLTSTDNRSAGNKPVAEKIWCAEDGSLRLAMRSIFEPEEADRWKRVSTLADSAWSKARMIDFQHAVERRTLWLYRSFWQEAGFQALWDEATKAALP